MEWWHCTSQITNTLFYIVTERNVEKWFVVWYASMEREVDKNK